MKPLYVLLIFALVLILSGMDRGFDISDEGLYALLAHPEQENQAGIFNYDLFFKAIFEFTGLHFGLIELRFIRLLLYGLGAWALATFLKNISGNKEIQRQDLLIALFGLFAGYAFLPHSLSYNHLTVVLTGFCLALVSGNLNKTKILLGLGLVLSLLIYVKITTAIILFLVSLGLIHWRHQWNPRLMLVFVPFLMLELFFFFRVGTTASQRLWDGIGLIQGRADYALWTLAKINLVGMYWIGLSFLGSFLISKWMPSLWLKVLAWILWTAVLVWFTHITEEWNHVVLLGSIPFWVLLLTHARVKFRHHPSRLWLLLLGMLPFLLHLGSNVYWLRLGIQYWVFWLLALWLMAREIKHFPVEKWMLGLGLLSSWLIFTGIWWMPFGQAPLWETRISWEYLPGKSIKLKTAQVQKLRELEKNAEIQSSPQILAAYRISGIPLLLGKTMPKSPGFWDQDQLKAFFPDSLPSIPLIYHPFSELPYPQSQTPILLTEF